MIDRYRAWRWDRRHNDRFGDRMKIDWRWTIWGFVGVVLAFTSLAIGNYLLVAVNAVLATILLTGSYHKSYWSVSRCPHCEHRAPGHYEDCGNWYHTARWN